MSDDRVKILMLGPSRSGKTTIANYLANYKDSPGTEYKETVALRIMEFDPEGITLPGRGTARVTVELWDVGGNHRYQACWPACASGAQGVIFVFNIENKTQLSELEYWYKMFCTQSGVLGANTPTLRDENCVVFAHRSTPPQGNIKTQKPKLPGKLSNMRCVATSLDYASESNWKAEFDKLVANVVLSVRQEEENALLKASGMDGPMAIQPSL